jgi:ParB-like chromosome segregation protein Spo0J
MLNLATYEKAEAVEALMDDYDLSIATLDADIALTQVRMQKLLSRLKKNKPANAKRLMYQRLMSFKKTVLHQELKKLTYLHYQDGLKERLRQLRSKS